MSHATTRRYASTAAAVGGFATTAALILASVMPASAAVHRSASRTTTIYLAADLTSDHKQTLGAHNDHAGVAFEFTNKLSRGTTTVGRDAGAATFTDVRDFEVAWTLMFKGGSIQANGIGQVTSKPFVLSITGGTGKYTGASGTMTVTDDNKPRAHYLLRFTTP